VTTSVTLPGVDVVGRRAAELLTGVEMWPGFGRLRQSSEKYADCWSTFTGFMAIERWDEDNDRGPLFAEAMRVLALKAAVFELTGGDEKAAELVVPAPVDEMVHAVLAQANLCFDASMAVPGMRFVHMTDNEEFGWNPGDYTEQCYLAAGWGTPPDRYWIPYGEYQRRLAHLAPLYGSIGIERLGRQSTLDFADDPRHELVDA
jgi:hypothetical protein